MSKIPQEFLHERQGRTFVLYGGLLDLAHKAGLKQIFTSLIQTPNEGNGNVAICKATVELEDGRKFDGIGDASPFNVGRAIAPHIIRMSETRSKARALRDAVNVNMTALEELGEEEAPQGKPTKLKPVKNDPRTPGGALKTDARALYNKMVEDPQYNTDEKKTELMTLIASYNQKTVDDLIEAQNEVEV